MLDLFGNDLPEPAEQLFLPLTFRARIIRAPGLYLEVWNTEKGKDMGKNTETFAIGKRWSKALKKRFPDRCRSKTIARAFDIEVKTADVWLSGGAPQAKHFCTAWHLFGAAMVAEVIAPESDWAAAAEADKVLSEIETKLKLLDERLVFLRSGVKP